MKLLKSILNSKKTTRFINEILMLLIALGLVQLTIWVYPEGIYSSTRFVMLVTILLLYILIHVCLWSSSNIEYLEEDSVQKQGKEDEK